MKPGCNMDYSETEQEVFSFRPQITHWFWCVFRSWCLMCLLSIDPQGILVFVSACVGRYQLMRFIRWFSRITFSVSPLRHELSAPFCQLTACCQALPRSDFTQWDGWHQSHNPKEKLILLSLSSTWGETGFGYLSSPHQLSFIAWLQYVQWLSVSASSVSHITISQQALAWSPVCCTIPVKLNKINLLIPTSPSPCAGRVLKFDKVCMLVKTWLSFSSMPTCHHFFTPWSDLCHIMI